MHRERTIYRNSSRKSCTQEKGHPDRAIARLAAGQHGVVAIRQLLAMGLTRDEVDYRLGAGRLHSIHAGVYAVGVPSLTRRGRWTAAVLAGGPGALLSHRSAAVLWGMVRSGASEIHATVPRRLGSRGPLRFHLSAVPADERTERGGIPVTGPFRTLLDLATQTTPHELERAVHECEVLRLADAMSVESFLDRHSGRRGVGRLRAAIATLEGGALRTRSPLEDRFLAFVAERGLPRPETNVRVRTPTGPVEVDCLWRASGLVVELDGRAYHDTRRGFDRDPARRRALAVAGLNVVVVTSRHLARDADTLESDLRALTAASVR
jgi:very-short-patch-repair endonuclease